jgi:WD40 repeat protein
MAPPLDRMVERSALGESLLAAVTQSGSGEVALTTGLHGAGGYGKTTLAVWTCHQPRVEKRFPGGLLWATLGAELRNADLAGRINDLSWMMCGQRPALSDPDTAGAALGRLLDEQNGAVLLVIDDVWDETQLASFRYGGRGCTRLVTTRIPNLLPIGGQRVEVDAMTLDEARDLIGDGTQKLPRLAAERLADLTGRWPVLLNLVNSNLRSRIARGQAAESAIEKLITVLIERGPTAFDPARPAQRERAVVATVAASLDLLSLSDQECFLDLAIFPEDVDIPVDILALLWPNGQAETRCEELARLGLVATYRLDGPSPRLRLHDVMRSYLRGRRSAHDQITLHARLLDAARLLLIDADDSDTASHWWNLPVDAGYLWQHLTYHLVGAGLSDELAALACDLRWVEAKTLLFGSSVPAEADLALVNTTTGRTLRRAVGQAASLLDPIDPPHALGATLASRLDHVAGLEETVLAYRATFSDPWLEPIWSLPDKPDPALVRTLAGHTGRVRGVAFSPDGRLIASASQDKTVRIWDVRNGKQHAKLDHVDWVGDLAFSPDGQLLASAGGDPAVSIWTVATGERQANLAGNSGALFGVAFSPGDGHLLASAGADTAVRIWDVSSGQQRVILVGHTAAVLGVAFSPNGRLLASASQDRTVRLWEVDAGRQRAVLAGHTQWVRGVAFSPDGRFLASSGGDRTVRIWDVAVGRQRAVLTGHTDPVRSVAFSPALQHLLASAGGDRTVRVWETGSWSSTALLSGHIGWVGGVAFAPNGRLLASTSEDRKVRIWEIGDSQPRVEVAGRVAGAFCLAFSPDGRFLASGGGDRLVRVWDISRRTQSAALAGHTRRVGCVAFSPDGRSIASAGGDRSVRIWQIENDRRAILGEHGAAVFGVAFSPDGRLVASAGRDRMVRIWQIGGGQWAAFNHANWVSRVAFSPDGRLVGSCGGDRAVRLWEIETGDQRALLGHLDWVRDISFSPDGRFVASCSGDRTVRLWEIETGRQLAVLVGHRSGVSGVAFSSDGRLLASVGRDRTMRIWEVESGRCAAALRVAEPLGACSWRPGHEAIGAAGAAGIYLLAYRNGLLPTTRS